MFSMFWSLSLKCIIVYFIPQFLGISFSIVWILIFSLMLLFYSLCWWKYLPGYSAKPVEPNLWCCCYTYIYSGIIWLYLGCSEKTYRILPTSHQSCVKDDMLLVSPRVLLWLYFTWKFSGRVEKSHSHYCS